MTTSGLEKHFQRMFEQIEKESRDVESFECRISKEIKQGRENMIKRSKQRRLIRSKRQWDE